MLRNKALKKPDIVPGLGNYRCVERGISTMRLALGYSTGLPKGWSCELVTTGMLMKDIFDLFRQAFPGREVHIYIPDGAVLKFPGTKPISILGPDLTHPNDYLFAFAYTTESTEESHFVIGAPTTYGGELQALYILAVSLEGYVT